MRGVSPRVLEGVDAVVNVGGLSNDPTAENSPRANHEMNTLATVALARLCKAEGVKRTSWPRRARSTTAGCWTRARTCCRTRRPRRAARALLPVEVRG